MENIVRINTWKILLEFKITEYLQNSQVENFSKFTGGIYCQNSLTCNKSEKIKELDFVVFLKKKIELVVC